VSPRRRDEQTGKFTEQYSRAEFLAAIIETETATTAAIAEYVGCSYDLAYRRLQTLEEKGEVTQIDIGGSFLWKTAESES